MALRRGAVRASSGPTAHLGAGCAAAPKHGVPALKPAQGPRCKTVSCRALLKTSPQWEMQVSWKYPRGKRARWGTPAKHDAVLITGREVSQQYVMPSKSKITTQVSQLICHISLCFLSLNIYYSVLPFTHHNYQHSTLLHVFPGPPSAHSMSAGSRSKDKQIPL